MLAEMLARHQDVDGCWMSCFTLCCTSALLRTCTHTHAHDSLWFCDAQQRSQHGAAAEMITSAPTSLLFSHKYRLAKYRSVTK